MNQWSKRSTEKQKAAFMQLLQHTHDCTICLDGLTQVVFMRAQTFKVCPKGSELHEETRLALQPNKGSK
jgi:hypothetical protein